MGPEPALTGYRTLWYRWIAPKRGIARITTPSSSVIGFGHAISVFRGSEITRLNVVNYQQERDDDESLDFTFPVEEGMEYQIAFGSYDPDEGGPSVFALRTEAWPYGASTVITPPVPVSSTPRNDQFERPTLLPSETGKFTIVDYNYSATTGSSSFEPSSIKYNSLWYRWTAPETSYVALTTPAGTQLGYAHALIAFNHRTYENLKPLNGMASNESVRFGFLAEKGKIYDFSFCTFYEEDYGRVIFSLESGPQVNPTAPKSYITSPPAGAQVSLASGFSLGFRATDPDGIKKAQFRSSGKIFYNKDYQGEASSLNIQFDASDKPGVYKIEFRTQDSFGRWGEWVARSFKAN